MVSLPAMGAARGFSAWLAVSIAALCACSCSSEDDPGGDPPGGDGGGKTDDTAGFEQAPVNVPDGPLCDIPADYVDQGGDPVNIPCAVEADRFSDRGSGDAPSSIRIATWNVEFGKDSAAVAGALMNDPALAGADVLLLQEVVRHDLDSTPDQLEQARTLATQLQMNYVFGVEFDRRLLDDKQGELGCAILSKYPIGNVVQIRHTPLTDRYESEQLYGQRYTIGADLRVGDRLIRVYSSHFDTKPTIPDDSGRAVQGGEVRAEADTGGHPSIQIVGGDFNTWTCNPAINDCTVAPGAEKVIEEFLAAGWNDGTAGFNGPTQSGLGFFPQRLDWLFVRGAGSTPGTVVETEGSDHFAVYTDVVLD